MCLCLPLLVPPLCVSLSLAVFIVSLPILRQSQPVSLCLSFSFSLCLSLVSISALLSLLSLLLSPADPDSNMAAVPPLRSPPLRCNSS